MLLSDFSHIHLRLRPQRFQQIIKLQVFCAISLYGVSRFAFEGKLPEERIKVFSKSKLLLGFGYIFLALILSIK